MADVLNVRPKSGIRFPRASPHGGFVGYELASGEPEDDDYVIPNGPRYRARSEPERVPNSAYYRRAVARGDLVDLDAEEASREDAARERSDREDEREDEPGERAHESEG